MSASRVRSQFVAPAKAGVQRRYGASDEVKAQASLQRKPTECPMPQLNDLSRCLAALDQDNTLIAVIEMSQSNWLVTGIVPGVERHPAKKLEPDEAALLGLLHRWRDEAGKAGRMITRIAGAFEAGRGGLLRAPCLRAAPARLAGLRTPEGTPLPPNTLAELRRDLARLHLINDQIREIEAARRGRLEQRPDDGAHPMVRLLARIIGVGIETADMLVQEILSRNLRDPRALARHGRDAGPPCASASPRPRRVAAPARHPLRRPVLLPLAPRHLD